MADYCTCPRKPGAMVPVDDIANPVCPLCNKKLTGGRMDNWKHRSKGMKCDTCMWYVVKEGSSSALGRCRRHAPTMSGYPVVFGSDWCGDHKLNEDRVYEVKNA